MIGVSGHSHCMLTYGSIIYALIRVHLDLVDIQKVGV